MRSAFWAAGAQSIDIEKPVEGDTLSGVCDLVAVGGEQTIAAEVKTVRYGSVATPRLRDLAQLAAYSHVLLENRSRPAPPLSAWLIYIELATRSVVLMQFRDASRLAAPVAPLLAEVR